MSILPKVFIVCLALAPIASLAQAQLHDLRAVQVLRDRGVASANTDPVGGVSIFASVQKLGLTLEHRKAPVEHLIVDHMEKVPVEN